MWHVKVDVILFLKIRELDSPQTPWGTCSYKDIPRTAAVPLPLVWISRNLRKTCFFASFWQPQIWHKFQFLTWKYSIYHQITIAHSIRLELSFLFLFLKVKSDHFSRFYGHFSDFSLVCRITRICQNDEIAIESSKMLGWSSNKFGWITNFTSFHVVFVFRSSIPIFSCQNSIFHVQLLDVRVSPQATGEKSLKWP